MSETLPYRRKNPNFDRFTTVIGLQLTPQLDVNTATKTTATSSSISTNINNASTNNSKAQFSAVVRYSLYFNIFFKIVTFIFNQLLIKFIPPSLLAFNHFLDFVINSVVFFAAEGIRLCTQRISIIENTIHSKQDQKSPIRKQIQQQQKLYSNTYNGNLQSIINLSYIPLIIGIPISSAIIYMQLNNFLEYFNNPAGNTLLFSSSSSSSYYDLVFHILSNNTTQAAIVILITFIAIIFNLLTEPFYNLCNYKSLYQLRTKFELAGLIVNCMFNFIAILSLTWITKKNAQPADNDQCQWSFQKLVVLIFALGRLLAAVTVYCLYLRNYNQEPGNNDKNLQVSLVGGKIYQSSNANENVSTNKEEKISTADNQEKQYYYFDTSIIKYWKTIFLQLVFKNFLTEGDKFIVNYFFSLDQQGIYSIINNYGSLITRLVFSPIEESLKLYLTKTLLNNVAGTTSAPLNDLSDGQRQSQRQQEKQAQKERVSKLTKLAKQANLTVTKILKFYAYLSFALVIFGYFNAPYLAQFLFSKIIKVHWWTNNTNSNANTDSSNNNTNQNESVTGFLQAIGTYVLYLPFLALNGILEAFFQSISTSEAIKNYSYYLSLCSGLFFGNCYLLITGLRLGLRGLIFGNLINMGLRIGYCSVVIRKYYRDIEKQQAEAHNMCSNSDSNLDDVVSNLSFNVENIINNWHKFIPFAIVVYFIQWLVLGTTDDFIGLLKSGVLGLAFIAGVVYNERNLMLELVNGNSLISMMKVKAKLKLKQS